MTFPHLLTRSLTLVPLSKSLSKSVLGAFPMLVKNKQIIKKVNQSINQSIPHGQGFRLQMNIKGPKYLISNIKIMHE